MNQVQISLRTPENWVIHLKVPFELHKRIVAFQKAQHCELNDKFVEIFDDGIVSEENIESFLLTNGF
jgi:hypothetical protein